MNDTPHLAIEPTDAPPTSAPEAASSNYLLDWREIPLRFTAQGSAYFKVWIVNLLLTLVTAGLYYPWAKVRRLRFFYQNTLVDQQPLSFHGDPRQMFKGHMIAAALFGAYSAVNHFLPDYHWVVLTVLALVYPLLVRASRRFLMANISWRGWRFRFTGSSKDALISYLPVVFGFGLVALLQTLGLAKLDLPEAPKQEESLYFVGLMVGYLLLIGVLGVWVIGRFIAYLQSNLGWGPVQTRFEGRMAALVGFFVKVGLLYLVIWVAVVVVSGLMVAIGAGTSKGLEMPILATALSALIAFGLLLAVVALFSFASAYFQSQSQNLIWNPTAADHLAIHSELRCLPLWRLKIKNWILIVLTLGLYMPFATVALARMRIESVSVSSDLDFDALQAYGNRLAAGVTGDAVADMFDLDLGL